MAARRNQLVGFDHGNSRADVGRFVGCGAENTDGNGEPEDHDDAGGQRHPGIDATMS
jgi:hypothetical protein